MSGWIKIHRSLLQWEWYDDIPVKVTFFHLLLSANHTPNKWRGIDIGRGQLWTSVKHLSDETGLSDKQIRNALIKLERTGEIRNEGASKGTMITICKYDSYQDIENQEGEQKGKVGAKQGQTKGEVGATNKNDKNTENDKKEKKGGAKAPTHPQQTLFIPVEDTPLMKWVRENAPKLLKMDRPLTNTECIKIFDDFGLKDVKKRDVFKQMVLNMENSKELTKKNESANLSIRNWWRRQSQPEGQSVATDTFVPRTDEYTN